MVEIVGWFLNFWSYVESFFVFYRFALRFVYRIFNFRDNVVRGIAFFVRYVFMFRKMFFDILYVCWVCFFLGILKNKGNVYDIFLFLVL